MGTICPYCNIEVDEANIELEDGCCPECGSIITVSSLDEDENAPAVFEEDDDFFDDIQFDDEDEDDDDYLDDDNYLEDEDDYL